MIADIISNKKCNPIVIELFIRATKLIISLIYNTQSYFKVQKDFRPNSVHYFILKIPQKRDLQ